MREMKLKDLKAKSPTELISVAEELQVENAGTMRKQELMFASRLLARVLSNFFRMVSVFFAHRIQIISPVLMIFMSPPPRSENSDYGPVIRWKVKLEARKKVNAISRS